MTYSRELKTLRIALSKKMGYHNFPASITSIYQLVQYFNSCPKDLGGWVNPRHQPPTALLKTMINQANTNGFRL